jgi:nitrogen fixation protein FixH
MSLAHTPRAGFRITGWHFLAMIVGFFLIVIAVDTAFVVAAVKTFPGEVSSTPYEDGLAYDKSFKQLQAQARLGWRATAAAQPDGVAIEMSDRAGQPITGLAIVGELERPATEAGKRPLKFREARPGRYVAQAGGLTGAWDFTAHATSRSGDHFAADRRLTWP